MSAALSLREPEPLALQRPEPILSVRGLRSIVPQGSSPLVLVDGVSLQVGRGETLAVVGESGSGKTMTFLSAIQLAPKAVRVVEGEVMLNGQNLVGAAPATLRQLRGTTISMVFQDPLTGLNPVFPVGEQIVEVLRAHLPLSRKEAHERAVALLDRVRIPAPSRRFSDYPHQFSGGMRQRVLIAMAIALGPKVLIADEPTTALDVTVQAQVLDLLAELQHESGMALVLITHDLGVVARYADHVAVMYSGRVVEEGPTDRVFGAASHPYTVSLFRSIPHLDGDADRPLTPIEGQPPQPGMPRQACAFEPRCFLSRGRQDCRSVPPGLEPAGPGQKAACHHRDELGRPLAELSA
ncbi:ABC transporter ATP-binding protein [Enterovirga sp. CN4-39]|uniref:ABC transporter ATP-binding protein n=1 Tax=Enterovirga sp. CN4-39 TaxID=3400910 RepID=UPI003C0B7305